MTSVSHFPTSPSRFLRLLPKLNVLFWIILHHSFSLKNQTFVKADGVPIDQYPHRRAGVPWGRMDGRQQPSRFRGLRQRRGNPVPVPTLELILPGTEVGMRAEAARREAEQGGSQAPGRKERKRGLGGSSCLLPFSSQPTPESPPPPAPSLFAPQTKGLLFANVSPRAYLDSKPPVSGTRFRHLHGPKPQLAQNAGGT